MHAETATSNGGGPMTIPLRPPTAPFLPPHPLWEVSCGLTPKSRRTYKKHLRQAENAFEGVTLGTSIQAFLVWHQSTDPRVRSVVKHYIKWCIQRGEIEDIWPTKPGIIRVGVPGHKPISASVSPSSLPNEKGEWKWWMTIHRQRQSHWLRPDQVTSFITSLVLKTAKKVAEKPVKKVVAHQVENKGPQPWYAGSPISGSFEPETRPAVVLERMKVVMDYTGYTDDKDVYLYLLLACSKGGNPQDREIALGVMGMTHRESLFRFLLYQWANLPTTPTGN